MLEQRDGEVVTPMAVAAPREFAKTTVCAFGYVLHQICFRKRHFILIGSDTEDLASDLTGYIYLELLYNERLQQDFGELVKGNKPVDDFVTLNDIRVKARGRGSASGVSSTSSGGRTWPSWMTWRMTPTCGIPTSSNPSWTG